MALIRVSAPKGARVLLFLFSVTTHAAVDGVVLSTTTCKGVLGDRVWAILSDKSSLSD